ncbi:Hypothetical predicted protein [Cloeon dipterum]|uniref:WD repeat-containing protein 91 n=1 Tax=Cloeon dipterum TaxID=197152 RepID=A0A8S1BYR9_9INSE|nr:Hypothetical predicted protein [Cloeon dipterum]
MKALDNELKADKDKGFRADRIVDQIVIFINSYDLIALRDFWTNLDQKMFSKLDAHFTPAIRKLESSVLKFYVINTVSNNKTDKMLEFFSKMSSELQGQPEWKEWFALPYVRNPEESHIFAVYFTRHWQDTLLASLHNLLALTFQSIPPPTLASFEDEAVKMRRLIEEVETLKAKLASLGVQDNAEGRSNVVEQSRTELMDDFYIIGKRETVSATTSVENQSLSLKNIMRNISGGIPTSPILGRKQQLQTSSSRRFVTSSSVDEKRSSSKTRVSSQRSIGADTSPIQKLENKASPKFKDSEQPTDVGDTKIPETDGPYLLLSQEVQEIHNSAITQCKFNNSGSLVASGDVDGVVKVWSTSPAPKVLATFQCKSNVVAIDWLGKHERFFILGTKAGSVYLCDSAEKKVVWELGNQPGSPLKDSRVLYVCCSPSEPQIVCSVAFPVPNGGDPQGKLFLLDVKSRKLERSLSLIGDSSHSVLVGCCTYNHNGQLLVAGATDGVVRIFDIRKGECFDSWLAHEGSVLSLQLSADFTSCFTLGQDGKFCQRNLNQSGHRVWETTLPEPLASGIHGQLFTFDQTGHFVLICGRTEDSINQVNPQGLSPVLSLGMNKGGGGQGAFSTAVDWCSANDCSTCLVGMSDGKIKISTLLQQ